MRTQFLYVGLLSMVAGGLVGTAGCDNVTAGQPSDPSGPPQLVHVLVQDARAGGPRNTVVDLIDNQAPIACSDINPCVSQFNFTFVTPDVTCYKTSGVPIAAGETGTCNDPLKVTADGVPLFTTFSTPAAGDAGSGEQIRIVFNKVLDNSIETVTMDPTKAPGKTNTYALVPTVAKLIDATTQKEVDSTKYYDNGGSPTFSSDLELAPLGPAIVIKPNAPLSPSTKYAIVVDPSAIKDRQGNAAVDQNGGALPTTIATFTTEAITANAGSSFPDFSMAPTEITANEVLQFAFWTTVDPTTAVITLTGPAGVTAFAYPDQGDDPKKCSKAGGAATTLDIFNGTDAAPMNWPAGDYTLSFTVKSDLTGEVFKSDTLKFTVKGTPETDPMKDPNIIDAHVTPAQCMMP